MLHVTVRVTSMFVTPTLTRSITSASDWTTCAELECLYSICLIDDVRAVMLLQSGDILAHLHVNPAHDAASGFERIVADEVGNIEERGWLA